jgi:hypothetical protein
MDEEPSLQTRHGKPGPSGIIGDLRKHGYGVTYLGTERTGLVTLHLKAGAPEFSDQGFGPNGFLVIHP